jgi:hypothetical protein
VKCKTCKYWALNQKNIGLCTKNIIRQVGLGGKVYITCNDLGLDWYKEMSAKEHESFAEELMTDENFGCINYEG